MKATTAKAKNRHLKQVHPAETGVMDPVCGMRVDPVKAAAKAEHDGRSTGGRRDRVCAPGPVG